MKRLDVYKRQSLTNIEITEQNIKAFSAVAKKYDIDYALKKDPHTQPPHYYVCLLYTSRCV